MRSGHGKKAEASSKRRPEHVRKTAESSKKRHEHGKKAAVSKKRVPGGQQSPNNERH
jgi:hypothetical protein